MNMNSVQENSFEVLFTLGLLPLAFLNDEALTGMLSNFIIYFEIAVVNDLFLRHAFTYISLLRRIRNALNHWVSSSRQNQRKNST